MAEAVDSIIAVLEARLGNYAAVFNEASDAHERFTVTRPDKVGQFSTQQIDQYANRHKQASNDVAQAEEAATAKITRTRKTRADQSVSLDKTETASAKAAAREKADAAIAESERELAAKTRMANIEATLAERAAQSARGTRSGPLNGTGINDGPQRPLGSNAAAFINGGAAPEVAAAKEVDALTADIATKQAGLNALKGAEKREQQDILSNMRLEKQLRAAGIEEEEILLRLETQRVAVAAARAAEEKKASLNGVTKFAEGAGIGRGGSGALVGGLVAASVATGVYEAAKAGLDYANNLSILSKQLGITTKDLQVYQSAAESLGVTNEQLRTSFGQLASNIGKAQEGAKEQGKIFGKDGLGIDLGNARDGYKSLGDLLPTIIDRFSKIPDQARRAALETALFGESGRKLDPLLSGGTASVNQLADALEKTGAILSGEDIARSAKAANDLKRVGDQLERELASTVSQNASAITSLAKSLLEGASAMLQFINAFQRFQALSNINTGDPANVAAGQAVLNQTPEGRSIARRNNEAGLAALRRGARSGDATINVGNGIGEAGLLGPGGILGGRYIQNTPEAIAAARKQLLAQRRGIVQAESAAAAQNAGADTNPQAGKPGNLNVFASYPKKGPKGKSADQLQNEADERTRRFNDLIARLNDERLSAVEQQTSDEDERRQLQRDQIDRDRDRAIADLKLKAKEDIRKGADARLTNARLDQAIAAETAAAGERVLVINLDDTLSRIKRDLANQTAILDLSDEMLSANESLAHTAKERKEIELRLLANARARATAAANAVLARADEGDPSITKQDIAGANRTLKTQDQRFSKQTALINERNRNPIQRYRDGLDDPETAVQQAVADKLKSVDDAITNAAANVLGIKDPFLKSLLQIFLQQNVLKPLYDAVQGANGGSGLSGVFGSVVKTVGSLFGGARANGGAVEAGKSYLVGERGPEIATFGAPGTITPNHAIANVNTAASNRSVAAARPNVTVLQPIHADFTGARTDEQTMRQFQQYADARAKQAYDAAVATSGAQAPALVQQNKTLKN